MNGLVNDTSVVVETSSKGHVKAHLRYIVVNRRMTLGYMELTLLRTL